MNLPSPSAALRIGTSGWSYPHWRSTLCDDTLRLFESHDVALVAADTAGRHPAAIVRTASFAYVRLHGAHVLYESRYTDRELAAWARRVRAWAATRSPVYVYFDNDIGAHAPADAARLRAFVQGSAYVRGLRKPSRDQPAR